MENIIERKAHGGHIILTGKNVHRKVLIVNLEFPPLGGPGVQRVLKFVRHLPKEGWKPSVICGDRSTWHDWYDYTLLKEVPTGIDIFRLSFSMIRDYSALAATMLCNMLFPFYLFVTKEKILGGLKHTFFDLFCKVHPEPLLSWVYVATKKALQRHSKDKFDVVMTSGPPHITHMVGFMLKRLHQVKWVADFRDPWVDSQLHGDRLGISRRLDRLWERMVLKSADRIISVSPGWTRLLSRKLTNPKDTKVHIVYSGYDPDDIPDDANKAISSRFGVDTLHIHYNGTIQVPMNPDIFFKALAELKKEEPDGHINLRCTFTGLPDSMANFVNDLDLNKIVIDIGRLSHHESLQMSLSSDVLLLILNNVDKTANGQITGKVYEYLAMGKNILAIIPDGDLYALLKNYQECYIVGCNNLHGIVEILKLLMTKKKNGQLHSFNPPSWIGQYTRQAQTRRLAEILDNLDQSGL